MQTNTTRRGHRWWIYLPLFTHNVSMCIVSGISVIWAQSRGPGSENSGEHISENAVYRHGSPPTKSCLNARRNNNQDGNRIRRSYHVNPLEPRDSLLLEAGSATSSSSSSCTRLASHQSDPSPSSRQSDSICAKVGEAIWRVILYNIRLYLIRVGQRSESFQRVNRSSLGHLLQ